MNKFSRFISIVIIFWILVTSTWAYNLNDTEKAKWDLIISKLDTATIKRKWDKVKYQAKYITALNKLKAKSKNEQLSALIDYIVVWFWSKNYWEVKKEITQNVDIIKKDKSPCLPWYWFDWTSCIAKTSCDSTITEITLANWQTWSCMNLWATTVWDWITSGKIFPSFRENVNASLTWLWDYYQWWRSNTWFTIWLDSADNAWWWSASDTIKSDWIKTTKIWRQWPCPQGRHVPSVKDFQDMCNTITNSTCTDRADTIIKDVLKMPFAGYRRINGNYALQHKRGFYWSSSPTGKDAYSLFANYYLNVRPTFNNSGSRTMGYSIRCLKN